MPLLLSLSVVLLFSGRPLVFCPLSFPFFQTKYPDPFHSTEAGFSRQRTVGHKVEIAGLLLLILLLSESVLWCLRSKWTDLASYASTIRRR
ncbi:hypothetical protein B0T20DRAFT_425597 [Sordaria brevicollis]|uniref:Uncharacterized protein n=1 Tax=Sordaria brevicollis TaxID=83679 RepID=A0AAE0NW23_SORBR|nr:hypothetical protein B0T20DRAFT_425597 [Sordaria brevicollis]